MALVEIPDDIFQKIKQEAEDAVTKIMMEQVLEEAGKFVNVTDLSSKGWLFKHVMTGKTLKITAEWLDEGE